MSAISDITSSKALNALRQAAIERIRFFQKEIAERGLLTRIGIEQEFVPINSQGKPQSNLLDLPALQHALYTHVPSVERLHQETITSSAQYELVTGPNARMAGTSILDANPLAAAETIASFRDAINSHAARLGLGGVSFKARMRVGSSLQSSGFHNNISLWDHKGEHNLFHQPLQSTTDLQRHVANALIKTHANAEPAYLPNAESYERIAATTKRIPLNPVYWWEILNGVPTHAGYMSNKGVSTGNFAKVVATGLLGQPNIGSVAGRHSSNLYKPLGLLEGMFYPGHRSTMIGWEKPHQHRIESRLAGADVDPYVAVATDMAAVYQAVRDHVRPYYDGMHINPKTTRITTAGDKQWAIDKYKGGFPSIPLALNQSAGHRRFMVDDRIRELLGEDLYHAIAATTKPKVAEAKTEQALAESTDHFQRLVLSGKGYVHDTTVITDGMNNAIASMNSLVNTGDGQLSWARRVCDELSKSKTTRTPPL